MQIKMTRIAIAVAMLATFGSTTQAQIRVTQAAVVNPAPAGATEAVKPVAPTQRVNVMAFMSERPLAAALTAARAPGAAPRSVPWTAEQQRSYVAQLKARQAQVISAARALGGEVVAQLTHASNGVLMSIDANQVGALSRVADVQSVMVVEDFKLDLASVTNYVGATALQGRNPSIDGTGVRIAILDSGIDFTHRNLGGAGTAAAYAAAYGGPATSCGPTAANTSMPTWTSKVVGGFDFVGERWPTASPVLEPDPNPIDCQGHGTNVADIAAGLSADGTWKGMAPGAQLLAVKVCSAVATSCSGPAIVQGLEYSLDPNGDGDLSDAVHVVNMSLGANYGQRENASVLASQVVAGFGTVVVASAGNGGDNPYINGSPSSTPEAIAVAQTQVPGQFGFPLVTNPGGTNTNTVYQAWSNPITADITAPLKVDPNTTVTTPTGGAGCSAYSAGFFTGTIAVIRRNGCSVSVKTANATNAGALAVVIDDNVAANEPPSFSFGGGGTVYNSTITVTQAAGNALRSAVAGGAVTATISFSGRISLNGSMVATSSRGPNPGYGAIKPDIGAPGASVSAVVGSGTGTRVFGGTSGAAPVVAGGVAQLLQVAPSLAPHEVKARLMGSADNNILTNPTLLPGVLAPITRIGAGELRIDRAVDLGSAMWESSNPGANSLAFGYQATTGTRVLRKRVVVRNYGTVAKTYTIASSYRYAADNNGAVTISAPPSITVGANSSAAFTVQMTINPTLLPVWESTGVNGGQSANNGALLAAVEVDGYLTLTAGTERVLMPWHVIPRRSHNGTTSASVTLSGGSGSLALSNVGGATTANADIFSLTGTSPQLPQSSLPGIGDSILKPDLRAVGVRGVDIGTGANTGAQFAVSRWDAVSTPNVGATVRVLIDTNRDGIDDWQLQASRSTSNQNLAFLTKLTGCTSAAVCPTTAYFFTGADINTANWILTVPVRPTYAGSAQTVIDPTQPFNFRVLAVDNYFTGLTSDTIATMTYQLNAPRFNASTGVSIPVGISGMVPVTGAARPGSPSQTGLLLMWRDGMPGREASIVNVN
ncbi:MAG: S8 family serine peptidase [Burkholderiaceae bacterium]|jgi:hypothetical protein|nr:S8 family serine peptidase [Burkholderiaceae bacterium]